MWFDGLLWLLALPPVLWLCDRALQLVVAVCWPDQLDEL